MVGFIINTMSVTIRRLLVDALKPREVSLLDLSRALTSVEGVDELDAIVTEVDAKTETIKLTIRGANVDYDVVSKVMEEHSVAIRGVDEISVAKVKPPKPVVPSK